jgi:hypothetical protein
MLSLLKKLRHSLRSVCSSRPAARQVSRAWLTLETLEKRDVPAVMANPTLLPQSPGGDATLSGSHVAQPTAGAVTLVRDDHGVDQVPGSNTVPLPANLLPVASALSHSAESYANFVTAAYQRYLGRLPDAAGLNAWVSAMQSGLSDERLESGFLGSDEYIALHGGQGAGWVRGMYQDLLGRTPSDAEVQGWVNAL